jgi:hypothetical protein
MYRRITDTVIYCENENIWYVADGSGGFCKTENAGTTWNNIIDEQKATQLGCLALDPQNSNFIWVGTGENVGDRHVDFSNGIYSI